MKEWLRYAIAVIGYIAIAMVTKRYLNWTDGPIYFVLVLEVLPRTWRRVRGEVRRRLANRRGVRKLATDAVSTP